LKRILPHLVLAVSGAFGTRARLGVVAAQEVQQVCRFQFRGAVRNAIGIDQQRESDARLLAKGAGVVHVAEADGRKRGSGLLEFLLVRAQLRDMLAAEDSTVVTQKDNDGRILLPERSKADLATGAFRQHNVRKPRTERFGHQGIVSFAMLRLRIYSERHH
jgi:hypothetical protein